MASATSKITLLVSLLFAFLSFSATAEVSRAQLTSAIENREPVDNLRVDVIGVKDGITQVYYFTQLLNMNGQRIRHIWLYNHEPMANVELNIGSDNWRTYSSKRFKPEWQDDWRVEVWQGENLLHSQDFSFRVPE